MIMPKKRKIEFMKWPYRGVFSLIAKEKNMLANSVRNAVINGNPELLKRFNEIVGERLAERKKFEELRQASRDSETSSE